MARHAALREEIRRRIKQHQQSVMEQLPIGGAGHAFGGFSDGISLGHDGALNATSRLHDAHGVKAGLRGALTAWFGPPIARPRY